MNNYFPVVIGLVFGVLTIFLVVRFVSLICKCNIAEQGVEVWILGIIPVRIRFEDITEIRTISASEMFYPKNQGWLRLGTGLSSKSVLIRKKSGINSAIVMTPKNAASFVNEVRSKIESHDLSGHVHP